MVFQHKRLLHRFAKIRINNKIKSIESMEIRCKLLGIEAPKRVDVTTAGEKIEFKGFNFLPYTKLEGK